MPSKAPTTLRSRSVQPADRRAVDALLVDGTRFESIEAEPTRLFELNGRIVAACSGRDEAIATPRVQPEPIGSLDRAYERGDHLALIGTGLVVARGTDPGSIVMVHRLARTLRAQELGARYCIVRAPLPQLPPFDPGGIVQQIAAGSIDHPPVTLPIAEGFWPVGTIEDTVVMVLRNDAF